MVQINVSWLLQSPIGSVRDYSINEITDIGYGDSPVQGDVTRTDRGILVKGALDARIELACSRCLGPFSVSLKLNIEEEYFPTTDIMTGTSPPVPDEPGYFTIDEHNILDLTEATRQYALLATPMKPLCQEDCAGLCPTCGQNLNQAPCNCPPQTADPRWAELSKLALADGQAPLNE